MPPFGHEIMTERIGETITGEVLHLDGYRFIDCRIVRCKLTYSGDREWSYTGTVFIECSVHFAGRAQFILEAAAALIGRDHWLALFDSLGAVPPPKAN